MISQQYIKDRVVIDECGCWIWQKSMGGRDWRLGRGYGKLGVNGKILSAHRASWEVFYGPIPGGLHVCHRCDNTTCCNPEHLFLGSNDDNRKDSVIKKRHAHGTSHGQAKLSEQSVGEIRSLAGMKTGRALAMQFNVSPQQISKILKHQRWFN